MLLLCVQVLLSYGLRGRLQAALLPQPAAPPVAGTARQAAAGVILSPPVLHGLQSEMLPAPAAALEPQILQLLHEVPYETSSPCTCCLQSACVGLAQWLVNDAWLLNCLATALHKPILVSEPLSSRPRHENVLDAGGRA